MEARILDAVERCTSIKHVRDAVVDAVTAKGGSGLTNRINILLICVPCGGFGDVVFALKVLGYLREWYGSTVKVRIATPSPDMFKTLSVPRGDVIPMLGRGNDCVEMRRLLSLIHI